MITTPDSQEMMPTQPTRTETKMSRRLWMLTSTLIVVVLMAAGCGDSSSDRAGFGGNKAPSREMGAKFADCIRGHGVSDFPDPTLSGDFEYGVSVSPAVWQAAVSACKELQPPGALSSKRTPKQQKQSITFAQCIRGHGVKDFPDPVNGEPAIDTNQIPSSNRPGGMNILNAAIANCRSVSGIDTTEGQG